MRVIAGTARSLPLKTVKSDKTRPTTDRIKETLFNMMNPLIPNCRFLDLFSGSGAIGIEALSRGADHAVFVDSLKEAVSVIKENLNFTHLSDRAEIYETTAQDAVRRIAAKDPVPFDIIFMDPPYHMGLEEEMLSIVANAGILSDEGILIIEAAIETDFSFAESMGYTIMKEKKYKSNKHVWLTLES